MAPTLKEVKAEPQNLVTATDPNEAEGEANTSINFAPPVPTTEVKSDPSNLLADLPSDDNEPATFVEMGALDGLKYSNTLAFERALNWRGVLIEANPAMCELLFYTTAHNRTRSQPLCTGVSKNYSRLQMEKGAFLSTYGEVNEMDSLHLKFHQRIGRYQQDFVPSAPLGQLLRMAGLASIDLFSLDVEGSELKVLNTHDWSLPVRVWCIEVNHERLPAIDELLTSKGYRHTPWQATGNYSLAGSDLWVWPGQWTPAKYKWKQYR